MIDTLVAVGPPSLRYGRAVAAVQAVFFTWAYRCERLVLRFSVDREQPRAADPGIFEMIPMSRGRSRVKCILRGADRYAKTAVRVAARGPGESV